MTLESSQLEFENLYHRAFADYKLRALWNVCEIEQKVTSAARRHSIGMPLVFRRTPIYFTIVKSAWLRQRSTTPPWLRKPDTR